MYIGQIDGGPELRGSTVDRVIARIAGLVGGGEEDSTGSLDVVLHVHGSLLSPEHVGVRTARFSKKERMLMMQIAVPKGVVESEETEIQKFILASLREAVCLAEPVFRRANIPYHKDAYLSLIDAAGRALTH